MRKFSWFKTKSIDDNTWKIHKTELTTMPTIESHQVLVKVSACLLCAHSCIDDVSNYNNNNNDCNSDNKSLYPLSTDIIGRVEKAGENVTLFVVGDIIMGIVDFGATKQSGCSNYCVVDEACAIMKASNLKDEIILSSFSDLLQIELLLNFLPKFPIKYSFLISGKALLPLNQLLIHKLIEMNCKVIACIDNSDDAQLLNSIFKDLVIIDTNNYHDLTVAIMDETCGLGVSAIFHLGAVLNSNFTNTLIQCLSFNGTMVVNQTSTICSKSLMMDGDDDDTPQLPHSLFDNLWYKKSALLHYFNYESTIHCGVFIHTFQEIGKKIFDSLANKKVLPLNKNVIQINKLEEFVVEENFLNSNPNYKVIVTLSEPS